MRDIAQIDRWLATYCAFHILILQLQKDVTVLGWRQERSQGVQCSNEKNKDVCDKVKEISEVRLYTQTITSLVFAYVALAYTHIYNLANVMHRFLVI